MHDNISQLYDVMQLTSKFNFIHPETDVDVRDRLNILFQQLKYDRPDYNLTKIRF